MVWGGGDIELLGSLDLGIVVWRLEDPQDDLSLRLEYANPAAETWIGRTLRNQAGETMKALPPLLSAERARLYASVCRDQVCRDLGVIRGEDPADPGAYSVIALPMAEHQVAALFKRVDVGAGSASQHFLDSVIEHIPAMVFVKRASDLRFVRFNRAGEELLGLSRRDLIGKSDYDFFPREQADFFVAKDRRVLERKLLEDIPQEPIETPRGTRWLHTRKIPILDARGAPQYLLGISIDITERKQADELLRSSYEDLQRRVVERTAALASAEEQLRQSQKLEAIGRLAGGIAHDFNNLLSVILSYTDVVLGELPAGDPHRADLDEIKRAGARASELTQQLLAFGRRQVLQPRILDLNLTLRSIYRMLLPLVGEDVDLRMVEGANLDPVMADPGQIEQVIMNLVVNARDAMPTGGRLAIETANVDVGVELAASHPGLQPGPHVMLAITDTGCGMDEQTLANIFEPFYTTKPRGAGTGLGLATVFGIVKQSGGTIWVDSAPGRGSTFRIYLPRTTGITIDLPRLTTPPRALHGTETVLLVEDEQQVRMLAASLLRRQGYRVLECKLPSEAMQIAASQATGIDLLLTDVVMPEMSGPALAAELSASRPGLRLLFMSGYTDEAIMRHGFLDAGAALVQKPITPDLLVRRVREVLDGPAPA